MEENSVPHFLEIEYMMGVLYNTNIIIISIKSKINRKSSSELFLRLQFPLVRSGKVEPTNGNKILAVKNGEIYETKEFFT